MKSNPHFFLGGGAHSDPDFFEKDKVERGRSGPTPLSCRHMIFNRYFFSFYAFKIISKSHFYWELYMQKPSFLQEKVIFLRKLSFLAFICLTIFIYFSSIFSIVEVNYFSKSSRFCLKILRFWSKNRHFESSTPLKIVFWL